MKTLVKEIRRNGTKNGLTGAITVTAGVELITPEVAQGLLDTVKGMKQRPISKQLVNRFARDIREGRWHMNGESVVISCTGKLADGQHRMSAVIEAGPANFLVVRGVPDEAFVSMGQGKARSLADVLHIHGKEYYKIVSVLLNALHMWKKSNAFKKAGGHNKPSNEEMVELLKDHPGLEYAASYVGRKWNECRFLPVPVFGLFYYLLEQIDSELRNTFFSKLVSGAGMESGDPVLLLRNRLIKMREKELSGSIRYDRSEHAALLVKTWNAIREGKEVKQIRYSSNEGFPRPI